MGREVLSEMRRIKKRDLICYLEFICAHDSTGVTGLQAAMIRVLAERMPFEDKQQLIANQFSWVETIQAQPTGADEELIRKYYGAVTATIKQAKEAQKGPLGKRENNASSKCKQRRAGFLRFGEEMRFDRVLQTIQSIKNQ